MANVAFRTTSEYTYVESGCTEQIWVENVPELANLGMKMNKFKNSIFLLAKSCWLIASAQCY